MSLAFLSVKTSDDGGKERIVAISAAMLDGAAGRRIWKSWGDGGMSEREMLTEFAGPFWGRKWDTVPVCMRAEKVLGPLWRRSMAHGLLEFGADPWGAKPVLDLQPVLCLLNADAQSASGADDGGGLMRRSAVPPMFLGASLSRFTGTMQTADSLGALLRAGLHKAADRALEDEADAFVKLWGVLRAEAPRWWRERLAGVMGC